MAPVVLECPNAECALGADGAKYETQALEPDIAMEMMKLHVQKNHTGPVRAGDGTVILKLSPAGPSTPNSQYYCIGQVTPRLVQFWVKRNRLYTAFRKKCQFGRDKNIYTESALTAQNSFFCAPFNIFALKLCSRYQYQ